jgi:hypothetical protein
VLIETVKLNKTVIFGIGLAKKIKTALHVTAGLGTVGRDQLDQGRAREATRSELRCGTPDGSERVNWVIRAQRRVASEFGVGLGLGG